MSTPELQLQTLFFLDGEGRISGRRSPLPSAGPLFMLIRGMASCAWAVRHDLSPETALELDRLAQEEPPVSDFRDEPVHSERYSSLLGGEIDSGPAFTFPEVISQPRSTVFIEDIRLLDRHFSSWKVNEIHESTPIAAVMEDGYAVSVCFCARRSAVAAEAGIETAVAFRGRGLGPNVAAAWASEIRASGRIPLDSTSWSNDASLAVARKLGLVAYASNWSIS